MKTQYSLFCFVALCLAVFAGCGGVNILTGVETASVCDSIPDGEHSVICEIAAQAGTRPETVAGVLKVSNAGALAADIYTAAEASAFIDEIRAALVDAHADGGLTYAEAVAYVIEKYRLLPAGIQAGFEILNQFTGVEIGFLGDEMLSEYDVSMIITHLDEQQTIVTLIRAVALFHHYRSLMEIA